MPKRIQVKLNELKKGLKVYWNDPAMDRYNDDHSSGYYIVDSWDWDEDADNTMVFLVNESGSVVAETYLHELTQDKNSIDFITGD